jgi:hypothetical protein
MHRLSPQQNLAIRNCQGNRAFDYFSDIKMVGDLFRCWQNFAFVFYFADSKSAAFSLEPPPAEIKSQKLAQTIKHQATRHNRVVLKMSGEKPEIRHNLKLCLDYAMLIFAALVGYFRNPIQHKHVRQG